jgi:hypothetical protein
MIAVYAYLFLGVFYSLFLAYASVQNIGWSRVPLFGKVCILPVGAAFYAMDVAFNCTVGSLVFLQLPTMKTSTLSMRLKNNIETGDGWRKRWAALFVDNFLLPFARNY